MTLEASSVTDGRSLDPVSEDQTVHDDDVVGRSPLKLAVARYRSDRLSMVSLVVSAVIILAAVAAPVLVAVGVLNPYTFNPDLLGENGVSPAGAFGGASWAHPLGVEPSTGRDLLSRLLLALTWSLGIALTGTLITVVIGVVFGIASGFSGGWVDATVGRVIDLTLSFPQTMMLLALSAPAVLLIRTGLADVPGFGFLANRDLANGFYVILVLAVFGWPPVARVVRGQVLSLREREFVDAAVLMGASRTRLYFREVLPNVWAPVLVYFTLLVPAYISAEAAFSFLGVGIKPPTPTLGNILATSVSFTSAAPTYFFLPGLLLALTVVVLNLVGDGARDALDPKAHR